jgi:hypothetical protein
MPAYWDLLPTQTLLPRVRFGNLSDPPRTVVRRPNQFQLREDGAFLRLPTKSRPGRDLEYER